MIPKYKDIVDLIKKGSTFEAQEKIMELREAALGLQEENMELKAKLSELEEEIKIKGNLEFIKSVYWLNNNDSEKDGPFCQRCYDVEQKLVRLQDWGDYWRCMGCEKEFGK